MPSSSRALFLAIVLSLASLAGCASHPAPIKRSIRIAESTGGLTISPEDHAKFVKDLDTYVYESDFTRGNEFTLLWRTTRHDAGNRALRYFVGFGAGKAYFTVEAKVLDSKKKVIATKTATGTEAYGMFGGSFNNAINEAAENAAEVAREAVYPGE